MVPPTKSASVPKINPYYRGKKKTFICQYALPADTKPQTIVLSPSEYRDSEGQTLNVRSQLEQLSLCAYFEQDERGQRSETDKWNGDRSGFHRLEYATKD